MHKLARAVIGSVTILSLLSACSAATTAPPVWPDVHTQGTVNELPVGSEIVRGDDLQDFAASPSSKQDPWGSIRPDAAAVEKRIPAIIERGRLIVGVGQYLNRMGFRDPLSGELEGFEIDLAREISRDIFGDPDRVEFRYVENRRRDEALRDGDVDLVLRTWTITKDRQYTTEFSVPYLGVHTKLLVLGDSGIAGMEDLEGKTVCATRDSTPARAIVDNNIGALLLTRTWTDCLMAMQRNQADAIFSDDAILSGLQAQDPYTEVVDTGDAVSYYGVGMPAPTTGRKAQGLVMQVNSTLERIQSDGTWDELYDEWMQEYLGSPHSLPMKYRSEQEEQDISQARADWLRSNGDTTASRSMGTMTREDFDE